MLMNNVVTEGHIKTKYNYLLRIVTLQRQVKNIKGPLLKTEKREYTH